MIVGGHAWPDLIIINEREEERESVKTSLTNMSEVEGETHSLKAFRRCIS